MGASWWKKGNNKNVKQESVPKYLRFVRCSLSATVVKSCSNWHKRLSSSNQLGAQHVSPHQTTIKRKRPHLKDVCLLPSVGVLGLAPCQKLKQQWKNEVSGSSERLHLVDRHCGEEPWDQRTSGTSQKWCVTERPTVSLYLNELPD